MIVNGFALERISNGAELDWWRAVPPTVRVPGESITVDAAGEGWEFEDFRIVAKDKEFPDPPPISPEIISDRQFAHALWLAGKITFDEAMAFVQTGTIPAALQTAIDILPDDGSRQAAALLVAGATTFQRHHPMTEALRVAMNMTPEEADAVWASGVAL